MSCWNYASCQNASQAGAALLCEGRQPGTASNDLADRKREPCWGFGESCFEKVSTEAVFRLLLPNRSHWVSCLEQSRLSSPGGLCSAVHNCAQQLWFIILNVVPFYIWMITSSLGSQEKNANIENTESEQSLHSVGSSTLFPSPCCWST